MKKIYLLAAVALFAATPISARVLTFYNGDTPIENGTTVQSNDYEITQYGDNVEVFFEPKLYIGTDIWTNTVQITAKCITGQEIQLCAGGNCEAGIEVIKNKVTIQPTQKLYLQYEYTSMLPANSEIPVVTTEISAVDTKYPDVTANFTIVMNGSSGVTDVFANDSSFKAVAGGIEYDFTAATEVVLYSLNGEKVMETTLDGSGVLSTSHLPKGIYAYKAGAKSGKLYLR